MINEFVNNTVVYAFSDNNTGKNWTIKYRLDKLIEVDYYDTGVGLPHEVDFENPKTLSLVVIQNLTKQLTGTINDFFDIGLCINPDFGEAILF